MLHLPWTGYEEERLGKAGLGGRSKKGLGRLPCGGRKKTGGQRADPSHIRRGGTNASQEVCQDPYQGREGTFEEMGFVAQSTSIPIATGERLTTKYEFSKILQSQGASILQINSGRAGGILEGKKIGIES